MKLDFLPLENRLVTQLRDAFDAVRLKAEILNEEGLREMRARSRETQEPPEVRDMVMVGEVSDIYLTLAFVGREFEAEKLLFAGECALAASRHGADALRNMPEPREASFLDNIGGTIDDFEHKEGVLEIMMGRELGRMSLEIAEKYHTNAVVFRQERMAFYLPRSVVAATIDPEPF